jgi:hypothetical protein
MFSRDFFSKTFECNVEVIKSDSTEHQKAKTALPGKIGILVE